VESAGDIGLSNQELDDLRSKHVLGSGKNFQYGKDRPNSKAASDRGGVKKMQDYGPIKSGGTKGPSKREDRQYRPF
jgi:hypothetical protein